MTGTSGIRFDAAAIPLGCAWSSPFVRWQGALAELSSPDLAVLVTERALADRQLEVNAMDRLVLGWTVPQPEIFYGAPTVAARLGAPTLSGPMLSQACATGAASIEMAALQAERAGGVGLVVTTDRTSNGPTLSYPEPSAAGGAPRIETWVLDNFARDPWAGESMLATAEAVAAEADLTKQEVDEVTLLRYAQYQEALADDRAFQRPWMIPVELRGKRGPVRVVDQDQGVYETTREGLERLRPLQEGGVVSYGAQTHPADGCAGCVVTTVGRARALSRDGGVAHLLASGHARVERGRMPKAPVPAAQAALAAAGVSIRDVDLIKTHNPFAVNDLWFARETGVPLESMNGYGCSLIFGHPQAPTGMRLVVELLEALRLRGGGVGLFTGCAAGDTGVAILVHVDG